MITIEFENLKLKLISNEDIETIRIWRNSPHVAEHMEYQLEISEEDQKAWFNSLQSRAHLYFMVLISDVGIGMVNLKNIDWEGKQAEAGVFIGRDDFRGTITPILAVFILMKVVFECLGFEKLHAKISNRNEVALSFNKELGYKKAFEMNELFDQYTCGKNDFYAPNMAISKIQDLFNRNGLIRIYVDKDSSWIVNHLEIDEQSFQLVLE